MDKRGTKGRLGAVLILVRSKGICLAA